jgi:hypothetical protein
MRLLLLPTRPKSTGLESERRIMPLFKPDLISKVPLIDLRGKTKHAKPTQKI